MCTGFEVAMLAASTASLGSSVHAANTRPKPKAPMQSSKAPVVRKDKGRQAGAGAAANSSFGLLNTGSPTLLGS